MKRITDTARLDWMSENRAETEYVTSKVGPGWVRSEGWRLFVKNVTVGTGKTLRQAIDDAIRSSSDLLDKEEVKVTE